MAEPIISWHGKHLEKMTREELLDVIQDMYRAICSEQRELTRRTKFLLGDEDATYADGTPVNKGH